MRVFAPQNIGVPQTKGFNLKSYYSLSYLISVIILTAHSLQTSITNNVDLDQMEIFHSKYFHVMSVSTSNLVYNLRLLVYKHHNNTIRLTTQHKAALTTCVYTKNCNLAPQNIGAMRPKIKVF